MEKWLSTLVITHIVGGTISLICGLIPMVVVKGNNLHRLFGKLFFAGMCVVAITGFTVSVIKGLDFLLLISIFSFYLVAGGYRSLAHKKLHYGNSATWVDWLLNGAAGAAMLFMVVWGLMLLPTNRQVTGIISLVFGLIGIRLVLGKVRNFAIKPKRKTIWIEGHIAGMVGGYIAACTAFAVVNFDEVKGVPAIVPWLLPTVLGVPFIIYYTNKYTKPRSKTSSR